MIGGTLVTNSSGAADQSVMPFCCWARGVIKETCGVRDGCGVRDRGGGGGAERFGQEEACGLTGAEHVLTLRTVSDSCMLEGGALLRKQPFEKKAHPDGCGGQNPDCDNRGLYPTAHPGEQLDDNRSSGA